MNLQNVERISKLKLNNINLKLIFKLFFIMVKGTFVLSAHIPKTSEEKRRIQIRKQSKRYMVVVLAILVVFFYQYAFDNPSALQGFIQQNYEHKNHKELGQFNFNLLYALYSFPNIIIPFFGGTLIDRIGARIVFIITCSLCVIGQFVFSIGGIYNTFWIMIVGRIIFGFGGEVLQGAQSTIISNWFKPHQLTLVLGICISFPKMGSALNNYLTPKIAQQYNSQHPDNYENVGIPSFFSFFLLCFALICSLLLAYLDKKSEQKEQNLYLTHLLGSQNNQPNNQIQVSQLTGQSKYKAQSIRILIDNETKNQQQKKIKEQHGQHIKFKDILKLPATYWLLIFIATLQESLFIPFLDNGNKYYQTVFIGIKNSQQAGIYLIVPYVLGALLVPIMSLIVERIQKKSYLIIISSLFYLLTYLSMFICETSRYLRQEQWFRWIPVSLMGISIGLFCSVIIPTLPMIVNPKLLGTAFGLMEMMQNLALGAFPLIIGQIRQTAEDNDLEGFHLQTLFLFLLSCLCLGFSFILKAVDQTSGKLIDKKDFRKLYIKQVLKQNQQSD